MFENVHTQKCYEWLFKFRSLHIPQSTEKQKQNYTLNATKRPRMPTPNYV